MQQFIPKVITNQMRGYIISIKTIAPRDGFVVPVPSIPITLQPNDTQNSIQFKGHLLSVGASMEYEMVAIASLDEVGEYGEQYNQAFIKKASGTFGTKKENFLKWSEDKRFDDVLDLEQLKISLSLFQKVRNAAAHYPITGLRFGDRPDEIVFFIYNGKEHIIFDQDYWTQLGNHHQTINLSFTKMRETIEKPIKTVDLSKLS